MTMVAASLTGSGSIDVDCHLQVLVDARPEGYIGAKVTVATDSAGTQINYGGGTPTVLPAGFTKRLAARARCFTGTSVDMPVPSFRYEVTWAVTEFNITDPIPFE